MEPSLNQRFRTVLGGYRREFERNLQLHKDRIHCGPGCSACCGQFFQITEIEAAEVSQAVTQLPSDQAERMRERAQAYLARRAQMIASGPESPAEAWGSLPPPGARLDCPALEQGRCSIYEHRPVICRKFGMPLWNPDKPGRVYACELNFAEGAEIEDGRLIQIQTGLHNEWKGLQRDYNAAGGYRDRNPITVARAIVEDYRALVRQTSNAGDMLR